jgi:hypothetical protein
MQSIFPHLRFWESAMLDGDTNNRKSRWLSIRSLGVLIACIIWFPLSIYAQSSTASLGYGGLIVVPSAEPARDATLKVGFGSIPRIYGIQLQPTKKSVYYAALTAAPFFEVAFAVVKPDQSPEEALNVGDRTVSVKLRLVAEKKYAPAIAVGAHDFFGIRQLGVRTVKTTPPENFAACYCVATKSYRIPWVYKATVHIGYGTDWLPAVQNYLVGAFGGIELFVRKELAVMAEYDAQYFNFGVRLNLFSHLQGYATFMDGKEYGGGLNLYYCLGDL